MEALQKRGPKKEEGGAVFTNSDKKSGSQPSSSLHQIIDSRLGECVEKRNNCRAFL